MLWTKNPVLAEMVQTLVSLWDMSIPFTATVAPQKKFRILGCARSAFAILILHGNLQYVHYFCGGFWIHFLLSLLTLRAANEVAPHDRGQRFASKPPQLEHWVVELQFTWQRKVATFGLLAARCFAFSNFRLWPQRKKHPAIESRGDINMQAQAWGPSLRGLTLSSRRCQPDSTAFPGAYIASVTKNIFYLSAFAVKRNSRILVCSLSSFDLVANHCKSHASVLMLMP